MKSLILIPQIIYNFDIWIVKNIEWYQEKHNG